MTYINKMYHNVLPTNHALNPSPLHDCINIDSNNLSAVRYVEDMETNEREKLNHNPPSNTIEKNERHKRLFTAILWVHCDKYAL